MLRPDDDPAGPQALHVGRHQLRGAGHCEREHPDPGRQGDEGLRLPAQQPRIDVGLVPVSGDVAQVRQVRRLCVDDRMEVRAAAADHVLVHGEVRVPLGRDALEQAATRCEQRARASALVDVDGTEARVRVGGEGAQAATRPGDDHRPASEAGCRHRELDRLFDRESSPDLDRPAEAD